MQSTGPVKVVLVAIDMDGVPHQLAAVEIDPDDVRQALREGFMGTAYVFEMPIGNQASHLPAPGGQVMVRAILHDARIAESLECEELIPVLRPRGVGSSENLQ